jgi:hypothetical protein
MQAELGLKFSVLQQELVNEDLQLTTDCSLLTAH